MKIASVFLTLCGVALAQSGQAPNPTQQSVDFLFIPAGLIVSRPFGYVTLSLAIAGSAICVALAGIKWKKSSPLRSPSIAIREAVTK